MARRALAGEVFMRRIILVLLASGGMAGIGAGPAAAVGTHFPFCMQGRDHPALSDCTYTSYQQCAATASGRFLYCIANPYYVPAEPYSPGRRHRERSL
jgi:hypothetical protein